MKYASAANIAWFVGYLLLVGTMVGALTYYRGQILQSAGSAQQREAWQQWVDEAQRQAQGKGPVRRRAPEIQAPPALFLMRDYFGVCVAAIVVLCTALYVTFAFLLRGAARTRHFTVRDQD